MDQGDCANCLHLLQGKNSGYLLKKAVVLVKHLILKEDVQRNVKIINQCCFVCQNGYYIQELPDVMELVDAIKDLHHLKYQEPLLKLLNLCGIPPRLKKSSDLLKFGSDVKEYFSWFGYLLVSISDYNQQQQVADSLIELLSVEYPNHKNYLSLTFRKDKAYESKLCDILGDFSEIANDDIYGKVLNVILLLIEGTEDESLSRKELLQKHVIWHLITRFEPTWRERIPHIRPKMPTGTEKIENIESAFSIIFNLLKYPKLHYPEVIKYPSNFTLWSLQWAFRVFCVKEDRQLERNSVLAILLKIMDIIPDVLSGNLPFAYDIAKMAMSPDFPEHENFTQNVIITSTPENFDFMNLMLMCIAYFPHVLSSSKIIEECRIVPGLIKLMTNTQNTRWSTKQHCCFLKLCLDVFRCFVDVATDEFLECGGPYSVLKTIAQIRSFPEPNVDLLIKCFDVLNEFCSKLKFVKESVWFNEGLNVILSVCTDILTSPIFSLQKQILLSTTFNLLHKIVRSETEIKATMPLIMQYLRRYYKPEIKDPVMDPSVMCFVLRFLWDIFVRSKDNTKYFVKNGGVYLLLDIIHVSCFTVKLVALGALVDLCCRAQCIPYLITWRKDDKRIISLLMEIFRRENYRLHVKMGPNGEIVDVNLPIMGNVQFYQTHCQCAKNAGNPSIADLFVSCRPKIYCLLQILNELEADTTEIANDFYKLYNEELSVIDKVTLLVAENFLSLKMSEEWQELNKEFEKIGFEPTPADQAVITSMIEVTQNWGQSLQDMQKDVIAYNTNQEYGKELELYQQLREARLSDALEGLFQMKSIARTSERMFRISTNFNLMHTIESNLEYDERYGTLHKTFPSKMSIALIGAPLTNVIYVNKQPNDNDRISKDISFVSEGSFTNYRNQVRASLDTRELDEYCSKDIHMSDFIK